MVGGGEVLGMFVILLVVVGIKVPIGGCGECGDSNIFLMML